MFRGKRTISPTTAYGGKPWAFRPKSGCAVMYENDNLKEPDDADCMTEITGEEDVVKFKNSLRNLVKTKNSLLNFIKSVTSFVLT